MAVRTVFEGAAHKISASSLQTRNLVRIRGRGKAWHAELTDNGRAYLAVIVTQPPTKPPDELPPGEPPQVTGIPLVDVTCQFVRTTVYAD